LRWLQYEITNLKNNRDNNLLSVITSNEKNTKPAKLQNERQLLAMCYLQYLESSKFIGFEEITGKTYKEYMYGKLLEQSSADFDEAILTLLEMLRVFFPAAEPIAVAPSH